MAGDYDGFESGVRERQRGFGGTRLYMPSDWHKKLGVCRWQAPECIKKEYAR